MNPNAWQKDAAGLALDLTVLFRDSGRVRLLISNLARVAEQSRQAAWDTYGAPVFQQVASRRPGSRRAANALARRLRDVLFSGAAAEAPTRLRGLL